MAMRWRPWQRKAAGAPDVAEALARAARLGITPDRVLEEYRRIAFANLSHIVDWDDGKMTIKAANLLSADDVAAISEIVQSAGGEGKPYRVKLYDKKAALESSLCQVINDAFSEIQKKTASQAAALMKDLKGLNIPGL